MSNHCQNLGQKLNNWRNAIDELKQAKDQYLANFSDADKNNYQVKKDEVIRLREKYLELLARSYEEIEIKGKTERLFGPEYEALKRIYDGCGIEFLEQGEIQINNGRITVFSLIGLSFQEKDTDDIIQARTRAFKNIRYFKCLGHLNCGGNKLTDLDIRENKKLFYLYCSGNYLTNLNLKNNKELREFICHNNHLTDLDVRENKKILELKCSDNFLINLNVGENKELEEFECENNLLTNLDVRENKKLERLCCNGNFLSPVNIQEIQALGIKELKIFPQYPAIILEFLTKLKSEEPNLPLEQAITRLNEFCKTNEVQSKLIAGQIVIPHQQETERIVRKFFKE